MADWTKWKSEGVVTGEVRPDPRWDCDGCCWLIHVRCAAAERVLRRDVAHPAVLTMLCGTRDGGAKLIRRECRGLNHAFACIRQGHKMGHELLELEAVEGVR